MNRKQHFPKKIWCAWHQGLDHAPKHIQKIIQLWREFNPDYELTVFADPETSEILRSEGIEPSLLTPQVKADILRSLMLKKYGGVWVDATLLPTRSLDEWLSPIMRESTFFAFTSSGDPDLIMQNWFLAAQTHSVLMARWCDFYLNYFKSPRSLHSWKKALFYLKLTDYFQYTKFNKTGCRTWFANPEEGRGCFFYPYAIHNYHLSFLIRTDPEVRREWEACLTLWHRLPQMIQRASCDIDTSPNDLIAEMTSFLELSPVHKLNYRDNRFLAVVDTVRSQIGPQ
ncbi:capsular polysaccharide synthesis protein [Roseobacter sp. OBYS 0001]|uniref:capsular polysaccharide synthesis protein n=1 Tax=Roseobacter sp. OBYS 0001 TaxID=882651 RepID=UPI001C7E9363|nr:capsular polysaccharide synthesis protein [Roseobacter sp. OBYS 0001]